MQLFKKKPNAKLESTLAIMEANINNLQARVKELESIVYKEDRSQP